MLIHLPQSYPIAKSKIIGDNNIKNGKNKFLNVLKNKISLVGFEFKSNKNSGPKPIKKIKKYLNKITNEYFPRLPSNCRYIEDFDFNNSQDI